MIYNTKPQTYKEKQMSKQKQSCLNSFVIACLLTAGFLSVNGCGIEVTTPPIIIPAATNAAAQSVEDMELGSTKNVHQCGDIIFSGQFQEADLPTLKEAGVTQVISLRKGDELDWDEAKVVKDAGLKHASIAFQSADEFTDQKIAELRELLGNTDGKTVLHCGGGNRVGAVWMTHRVLDDGVELETAIEEAKTIGLKSEPLKERAIEYIKQHQAGSE